MKNTITTLTVVCGVVLFGISTIAPAATVTLTTLPAGDATYQNNSTLGTSHYDVGSLTMDTQSPWPYGYDPNGVEYRRSYFEVPISALAGQTVTSATLEVDSLGFGCSWQDGSASIYWLDLGAAPVTGNVVTDGLATTTVVTSESFRFFLSYLFHPDDMGSSIPARMESFDVLTQVQADLAAGRAYSTFRMSGSRETVGSFYTAENGNGPRIIATATPEPATMMSLLALGGIAMLRRRRK